MMGLLYLWGGFFMPFTTIKITFIVTFVFLKPKFLKLL
jgi:hypothetical protein